MKVLEVREINHERGIAHIVLGIRDKDNNMPWSIKVSVWKTKEGEPFVKWPQRQFTGADGKTATAWEAYPASPEAREEFTKFILKTVEEHLDNARRRGPKDGEKTFTSEKRQDRKPKDTGKRADWKNKPDRGRSDSLDDLPF